MADRKLVTDWLSDKAIDAVYSSPYKRAVDTVKDFADRHSIEIRTVDDLHERVVGGWIGENFGEFVRQQWADHSYKYPGGESLDDVQERNIRALKCIIAANPGKKIVIGTHGTALSTVINYFEPSFGYDEFRELVQLMPCIAVFEFDERMCVRGKVKIIF